MHNTEKKIVKTLKEKGFETYCAGGCVRDMIINHKVSDYDIASNAKPEEIEQIFKPGKLVGKNFVVSIIKLNNHIFEIATFRKDINYDGRRPKEVKFC